MPVPLASPSYLGDSAIVPVTEEESRAWRTRPTAKVSKRKRSLGSWDGTTEGLGKAGVLNEYVGHRDNRPLYPIAGGGCNSISTLSQPTAYDAGDG